jgi:N-acetylmuramoyl-L-alanine amidase
MTRQNATDDAPVSKRAGRAEHAGCTLFVSLHLNDSESEAAKGLEVLYRDDQHEPLAKTMHDELIRTTGFQPRGAKKRRDLAVLKFHGPAILIELGFISNDGDRTELLKPQVRDKVCRKIADVLRAQAQPEVAVVQAVEKTPAAAGTGMS